MKSSTIRGSTALPVQLPFFSCRATHKELFLTFSEMNRGRLLRLTRDRTLSRTSC
jgi:hypothetical protein